MTIAIDRQGDSVAVKVSNTGSSIPYNERTRIFERIYRGTDSSRTTSGSSLGLYVARKIAISHGGATASGFAVGEARNVEEALAIIQAHPFDLVLLDINMPGVGGIEACRRIREAAPHSGILMITVRISMKTKFEAWKPARTTTSPSRSSCEN